jgi:hypothetical protein
VLVVLRLAATVRSLSLLNHPGRARMSRTEQLSSSHLLSNISRPRGRLLLTVERALPADRPTLRLPNHSAASDDSQHHLAEPYCNLIKNRLSINRSEFAVHSPLCVVVFDRHFASLASTSGHPLPPGG